MAVPIASADELPIIDISALCQGDSDAAAKAAVAAAIRHACVETGFFYITGHGLDTRPLLAALQQLFDLPLADKEQLDARLSPLHRGYTGLGGAHNCVPAESCVVGPDNKESFLLGAEGSRSAMHGPNTWPAIPGWQQQVSAYFASLTELSRVVARGLALSLGLPQAFFDGHMTDPVAQLLLLRYPPPPANQQQQQQQPGSDASSAAGAAGTAGDATDGSSDSRQPPPYVGCGEHSDCGFLTILAQDEVGLQVLLPSGQWVVAPAVPGAFLVNLGDMTARWTNNLYRSTQHRVFNSSSRPRHSAVFFCNADFDALVEPAALDAAVVAMAAGGSGGPAVAPAVAAGSKYPPIKAGHYIMQKLGLMWDEAKANNKAQQQ